MVQTSKTSNHTEIKCTVKLRGFGQSMWQAEADKELTLSALPAMAVGQILLTMAKFRWNTVPLAAEK